MVYVNPGYGLTLVGKQIFGARVGKYKSGARAGKQKLEAMAGKYKLEAMADKYKLGDRTGTEGLGQGREPSRGPGAGK